jgi:hydroxymethylbilane synthase
VSPAMTMTVAEPGTAPGTTDQEQEMPGSGLVPVARASLVAQAPATVAAAYRARLVAGRAVRLGSRTSPMAMAQARKVSELLSALVPGIDVTITGITTSADQWAGDLAALGGKGAFTKEIDRALLMGEIDAAVHCMKDVPGDVPLPAGLLFAAYLPREDIRDCLVFPASSPRTSLQDLPAGARIGTSSVRRRAQLGRHRPDLTIHRVRGNVNSWLARLDEGDFDALIMGIPH